MKKIFDDIKLKIELSEQPISGPAFRQAIILINNQPVLDRVIQEERKLYSKGDDLALIGAYQYLEPSDLYNYLIKSAKFNGKEKAPILCCTCGEINCTCVSVNVIEKEECVLWKDVRNSAEKHFSLSFCFKREDYKDFMSQLKNEAKTPSSNSSDTVGNLLLLAAKNGNLTTVKQLLAQGADINYRNESQETALYKACEYERWDIAHALIEMGADVNLADTRGETPLSLATFGKNIALVKKLLQQGANVKNVGDFGGALSDAIGPHQDITIAQLLIKAGADVNEKSFIYDNQTPLFLACKSGRIDQAKLLLECGADVNIQNDFGDTPLWHLFSNWIESTDTSHYLETVQLLLKYGANVDLYDEYSSILTTICETNIKDVVRIVQMVLRASKSGTILSYKDCMGLTALDIAKKKGNKKLVKLLEKANRKIHLSTTRI